MTKNTLFPKYSLDSNLPQGAIQKSDKPIETDNTLIHDDRQIDLEAYLRSTKNI